MSREDNCVERFHMHVGICQRAGYRNGRADAIDEAEEAWQDAMKAAGLSDSCIEFVTERATADPE